MRQKTATLLFVLLVPAAAFLVGQNLGHRAGISEQIGGPGVYRTMLLEWRSIEQRKVVVYLNNGANGFAFWFQMDPGFKHYTHASKVFVCDNTNTASIKEALESARVWCDEDREGGDTRIVGGWLKDRADDFVIGEPGQPTTEYYVAQAEHQELLELRATVNEQALKLLRLAKE